jgi:hypothetical protein
MRWACVEHSFGIRATANTTRDKQGRKHRTTAAPTPTTTTSIDLKSTHSWFTQTHKERNREKGVSKKKRKDGQETPKSLNDGQDVAK